jgi:hypothetical protein
MGFFSFAQKFLFYIYWIRTFTYLVQLYYFIEYYFQTYMSDRYYISLFQSHIFNPIFRLLSFLTRRKQVYVVTMLSVFSPFQPLNALSDLHKAWYEGDQPNIAHFNFLQSVITSWQTLKFSRWEQYGGLDAKPWSYIWQILIIIFSEK